MNAKNKLMIGVLASSALMGCQSMSGASSPTIAQQADGTRQVHHTTWDKTGSTVTEFDNNKLLNGTSRMVFLRSNANTANDSVNVGIDNRFQVSLQGGQYSEVITCHGAHQLSAVPTANHSSQLDKNAQTYHTNNQATHYYYIDTDQQGNQRIREINNSQILGSQLKDAVRQTHQISRVHSICTSVIPAVATAVQTPSQTPQTTVQPTSKRFNLDVLFDFDSDYVNPSYNSKLEAASVLMLAQPNYRATIEGHTDSVGDADYNLQLSQKRADAVKQAMVEQYGVQSTRIMTQGFGETRPIASNSTAEGRQQNRRVVATLSDKP